MEAPLQIHPDQAGAVASLRIARNLEGFDSNDVARGVDVVAAIVPHGVPLLYDREDAGWPSGPFGDPSLLFI
jgi:hypothetical protein